MKYLLFIILVFTVASAEAQSPITQREVFRRDISQAAKELFASQFDTFVRVRDGLLIPDTASLRKFNEHAMIYEWKEGHVRGILWKFSQIGGTGCGYHELEEPFRVVTKNGRQSRDTKEILDFDTETVWMSGEGWRKEEIVLCFGRGASTLRKLIFFTGDQTSEETWRKYSRPKKILLKLDGRKIAVLEFENMIAKHEFSFDTLTKKQKANFSLEIIEVYPGEDDKVAISDIMLDGEIH